MINLFDALLRLLIPVAHAQNAFAKYYAVFGGVGSGRDFINALAIRTTNFFLLLVTGGAILAIMYSAVGLVMSAGNDEGKEGFKKTLQIAITGLILALSAQAILKIVTNLISGSVS